MSTQTNDTRMAIIEAGIKEFLEYGYEGGSLRRIAREASVTTGAIYGYFSGKEALFDAITSEAADGLLKKYKKEHVEFACLPMDKQVEALDQVTRESIPLMIDYVYDRFDIFKLILCKSNSEYCEGYLNQLAEIEEKSCWDFIMVMRESGHEVMEIDDTLVHILSHSFFQQLCEFVAHDVPREKAISYALVLGSFQHAGWRKIVGLD